MDECNETFALDNLIIDDALDNLIIDDHDVSHQQKLCVKRYDNITCIYSL